jgi:hypothetical protein
MFHVELWPFREDWLSWVKSSWSGSGRVELTYESSPERDSFVQKAGESFSRYGVKFKSIKTYLCVQEYEDGIGYIDGHPHDHQPPNAWTMVHYLQTGGNPAKLDIYDEGSIAEQILPIPGLTVIFKNTVIHGVHKHKEHTQRIALIATALV